MRSRLSDGGKTHDEQQVADLLEQVTQRIQAGESVDLAALAREHPQCAEQLRQLFPAMRVLTEIGQHAEGDDTAAGERLFDPIPTTGVLGDYRIIREIGRGGMGIVL